MMMREGDNISKAKQFRCCRDGHILNNTEETGNCSKCGQFYIFIVRLSKIIQIYRKMEVKPSQ